MPAFETPAERRHAWNPPEFRKASKATAEIIEAGKSHWVSRRSEVVAAKERTHADLLIDPSKRRWRSIKRRSSIRSKGSIEFWKQVLPIAWNDGPDLIS
jgi:hypothetical protein